MRERGGRLAACALALAVLACGCTRVGPATTANGLHPWTQPDRLRLASTEEPDSLNKLFANSDASDQIANLISAPILRYDDAGNYIPEMARTVPTQRNGGISPDGKTIVLHLRHGMRWSDGAPLDARDLRFTWQAVMNPRNNTRLRAGWDDITAIDLPDNDTAIVHLREPYAAILGIFALGGAGYPPLPAHVLAGLPDINHARFNERPLSSGPYVLRKWNHGASLEFDANPRYWRGKPAIAHLTYEIVPDADTLFNLLITHAVDVDAENITESQIGRLGQLTGFSTQKRLIANYRHITFNTRKPALSDVRVRLAIAEAVDWNHINATVFHGYNERATSDIMPTSWAAPTIPPYPFDLAGAKKLLDAAGWLPGPGGIRRRAGQPLSIDVSTTPSKPANVQAEVLMQQALRAAGIDLRIKNYPTSLLFAQDGPLYGGRYDLSLTIDTNAPDPDNEGAWSGAFIPPHGANTTFLNDPVITATSHAAARTFDRTVRKALYQREEARIHELVPAVFLYWQIAYAAYNSDLKHYRAAQYLSSNWNAWQWSF
ncbi:MAG TPA: peptide ABC transporter substrate-binding protein [Candidatus Lustribacter sp.]|jgi:peptide/nickel transport system substrate-binding protein|nr:peptide ABC transporter substrate-binding protein [Candidatus Lustribacter sp.]